VKALNESEVENLGNFQPLSRPDSKMVEDRSIVTVDQGLGRENGLMEGDGLGDENGWEGDGLGGRWVEDIECCGREMGRGGRGEWFG